MIVFRCIRYKNFLSSGNYFTEIELDKEITTLVLGANGSGKSTMLDAICFGLFGKPFRSITKPQLLNSLNQKHAMVEVEFTTGNKYYRIVRGIKPNVFEIYCDDKLLNQDASVRDYQDTFEKSVLKMNYKSFTQIVILGSASFTPFMQLSAADRRSIIEDLLDIKIFSNMNQILKERSQKLKGELTHNKYQLDAIQEKIEVHEQYIRNINRDNKEKLEMLSSQVDDERTLILDRSKEIECLTKKSLEFSSEIERSSSVNDKLKKLDTLSNNLERTIKKVDGDIKFYSENDNCPTCKQDIDDEFKSEVVVSRSEKRSELVEAVQELKMKAASTNEVLQQINEYAKKFQSITKIIDGKNNENKASEKYIKSMQDEIDRTTSNKDNVKEQTKKLKEYNSELSVVEDEIKSLIEEREYQDIATILLKDNGIKTKIIRQYIPIINKLVNKYLASMDFFVNFNLDESFKETIKSRHRDDFSYSSFSEGEKQRIDMALMLTWRTIAKLKNSASTNLLILDEVFDSSLDNNGTEDLMKLLNMLEATNLFVISHKGDILQDKFHNVLKFEKINNFSKIVGQ